MLCPVTELAARMMSSSIVTMPTIPPTTVVTLFSSAALASRLWRIKDHTIAPITSTYITVVIQKMNQYRWETRPACGPAG